MPHLTQIHELKRVGWCRKYMKLDFSNVVYTDESRVTLDVPDGWRRGWIDNESHPPGIMRRQQGVGGVMIWAGIVDDRLIGPFKGIVFRVSSMASTGHK